MATQPKLPKGTRDFSPEVMLRRNYILGHIRDTFEKFGFLPLETPAMENLSVLTGKYGDEGDRLLYKILNSGDYLNQVDATDLEKGSGHCITKIAEKGLRYDLTVPFARFVAGNYHQLALPFKRYQIQPVWRADRPQKGRYREFYQCDADVVGTASLLCEAEIIMMITEVFKKLSVTDYTIKFNHRKVLKGLAAYIGAEGKEGALTVAIDKLEKIGTAGVKKELIEKGLSAPAIALLEDVLAQKGSIPDKIGNLSKMLNNPEATEGLQDIQSILAILDIFQTDKSKLDFDISLARGLAYYTGMIFEVKINNVSIGSVSGGGRYDNLTGIFGVEGVPGTGFSFGVDRLYDAMDELNLFPEEALTSSKVLIAHFDDEAMIYGYGILSCLRENDIASEVYPDRHKIKKQLTYANKKGTPYVVIVGSDEMNSGQLTVKNMVSGDEEKLTVDELIKHIA